MTSEGLCSVCGKQIKPGQPMHGARGDHWDCVYPAGYKPPEVTIAEINRQIKKIDEIQAEIDRRAALRAAQTTWKKRTR